MRGDIVLFYKIGIPLVDWAIHRFTDGPYAHVEIDVGNGMYAGSHSGGLYLRKAVQSDATASVKSRYGYQGIDSGISWVLSRIEQHNPHKYGWLDILSDTLKVIHTPLIIGKPDHWDCSDFVTRYLIHAGAEEPLGDQANTPETVSPNDIARAFHILPPQKRKAVHA